MLVRGDGLRFCVSDGIQEPYEPRRGYGNVAAQNAAHEISWPVEWLPVESVIATNIGTGQRPPGEEEPLVRE